MGEVIEWKIRIVCRPKVQQVRGVFEVPGVLMSSRHSLLPNYTHARSLDIPRVPPRSSGLFAAAASGHGAPIDDVLYQAQYPQTTGRCAPTCGL